MRIARAGQAYQRQPFLKIAVYGASGAGKSDWAARAPRPLILLTEPQGLSSIAQANPEATVVGLESWADFHRIFNALKTALRVEVDGQPACELTLDGETFVYQTVVIDSFTDLQRLALGKLAGTEDGRDRLDLDAAQPNLTLEKWSHLTQACENIWQQQRLLPCNTIFLFLAEEKTDADNVVKTIPLLAGQKLPLQMGQYFNAVGLAQVKRGGDGAMQHFIRWQSATTQAVCKPAPGWPVATRNTRTPGQTTLGSLLLFSFPDLAVAREVHDDASFVAAPASPASAPASPSEDTATESTPAAAPATETQAPRRARRI
jgi:hypothetical protein